MNRRSVWISGQITDKESGKPISNAEVLLYGWHPVVNNNICVKKTVFTDEKGYYKAYFESLNSVDIASKTANFNPERRYNNWLIFPSINLALTKETRNPSLRSDLLTMENTPTISLYVQSTEHASVLDYTFGYDCKSFKTTKDTSNCDFWFKLERKNTSPTTIVGSPKGGVIAVYERDIPSSFLYDLPYAPKTGYKKECYVGNLRGEYAMGLFVLCRDGKTYAKIIFNSTSGISQGEYIKRFSCLYQPNGT
ncbi:MAG: carboxypeptidase regulatory-like domain-containing protein, partial [Verrucomicrobia bacterium]|nr:carboxypeptidase regulatory-like domain-containing protein [Cytophagales bacterium]